MTVIAASESFCRAFEIEPTSAPGLTLSSLGNGEWDAPQLRSLLRTTVAGNAEIGAYEMDLEREGHDARRLVLNARRLDYAGASEVRVVLAVIDVTEARLAERVKDDLLREKAILLQELQHRVANSLQIVASVLMLSARRVQSEETRIHLHDAHQRVMSVASVQRQLSVSSLSDVALRGYFNELCESLGASMIRNRKRLSIEVQADESLVRPDVAVSLGLIVTELVINALKHAFPRQRGGKIVVEFRSKGAGWALSVGDNGVGLQEGTFASQPGLGTNIVEALAKQLKAKVVIASSAPGTTVSIIHT